MGGVTTSIANWDFNNFHVQVDIRSGQFINAFSVLICAGPPKLRQAGDTSKGLTASRAETSAVAYPIGVIENFAMAQNRQLQRLFEIGSKRSYFVPGRNIGSINLARTLFHGPNLLRALYAYYPRSKINKTTVDLLKNPGRFVSSAPQIKSQPGFSDFFINLDSDLFDQPYGMLVIMRDSENKPYAAIYLEDCFIRAHQWSVNASNALVAEGITADFDLPRPVEVGAISTVQKAASSFDEQAAKQ